MLSALVAPCVLLLVTALCSVDGQLTPKCDDNVIAKIKEYYSKHGYPPSMAVGSKLWSVVEYTLPVSPVCVKQDVGVGQVTSTLIFTPTNTVVYTNVVTYTGDVQNGLVIQTVKGTGETIYLYIIVSRDDINVFYVCDPNSWNTILGPQGGVAVPLGKDKDENSKKEVKAMKTFLAGIGIKTFSITPCKE